MSRAFENVELLLAIKQTQTFVHATTDVLFRAIRDKLTLLQATLDTENNLVCVLRVLGEVLVEQVQRVVLRSAVQLATVPEVGTQFQGSVKCLKAHLMGWRLRVPGHS